MDVPSLAAILHATLSPNPDERKAAEQSLIECQNVPQHLVRVLQIIVDSSCDLAIRQVASIHFKNFVAKNWGPLESDEEIKISHGDKEMVRNAILMSLVHVPHLLRVQLGESLKKIIHFDYPEHWPQLCQWVKHNLQEQEQQVYDALFVLRILARKYQFKSDEERSQFHYIIEETFPHLLNIFSRLVQINSQSLEVAELITFVCKIFWSSIYLEIPKQLRNVDEFDRWMILFFNILERPVPLEGQPADPELRGSWEWWKVKKWTVQILNRLYMRFGDLKIHSSEKRDLADMYAGKILGCFINLLNVIRNGGYLPDKVVNVILQYLSNSISKRKMYTALQPYLDALLFEIIFPLMCFNDNDQRLWNEDPHEYVRKGYDIIEDLYSPRTASMDFISELMRKRGKQNLQKFIQFIIEVFKRYDESPVEYKPYRQKDGALLAITALRDKLQHTEPYKSELEPMLVQHVFPEFNSPVGHLRAKAAWVSGLYAHINYSDPNNFRQALHSVVSGLQDPELPVRIDSVFALRSFVEATKDLNLIRPILPKLLGEFLKLINEVENEDLIFTLESIVDKFGEEISPYAIGLCQNLTVAFWRCMNLNGADKEIDDSGALAAVGCLRAIGTIIGSVSRLPHLFPQIEQILLPIMREILTSEGQEVYEEAVEIVAYLTFFSPTISMDMWSLWPLLIEALEDWAIDFFSSILVPLDNYISRGTAHFLTCKEPDYQISLWNIFSSIMASNKLEDGDVEPAPKLMESLFQNCKGQVDQWIEPYVRITVERLHRTKKPYLRCLLIQVIANALYYNAGLTMIILQKLGVAVEVFNLWFKMLREVKKNGVRANFKRLHDKKVCSLGLTSLINFQGDQLPMETLGHVFRAALDFLVAYKDQVAEVSKESEEEEEDDDGSMDDFETDEENDNGSDEEMGTEIGDEAESIPLKKLAAHARTFQPYDEDEGGDESEDEDDGEILEFPIDKVDPFIFFVDSVQAMQTYDPSRFQNLMYTLDFHYQALADGVSKHAEERRTLIGKDDMEKAATASA